LVGHPLDRGRCCKFSFPFYFMYIRFLSFFILFLAILFLTTINLLILISVKNFVVSLWQVCSCLSLADALAFFTLWCFLTPGNVFLYYTLWTMCDSSLGVWKNTLSVCLFIFSCLFVLKTLKKKNSIIIVKFELNRSCGLHFISLLKVLNILSYH